MASTIIAARSVSARGEVEALAYERQQHHHAHQAVDDAWYAGEQVYHLAYDGGRLPIGDLGEEHRHEEAYGHAEHYRAAGAVDARGIMGSIPKAGSPLLFGGIPVRAGEEFPEPDLLYRRDAGNYEIDGDYEDEAHGHDGRRHENALHHVLEDIPGAALESMRSPLKAPLEAGFSLFTGLHSALSLRCYRFVHSISIRGVDSDRRPARGRPSDAPLAK